MSRWLAVIEVCIVTFIGIGTAFADSAFVTAQAAAAAKNPPGLTCTLRLPSGQTQFQQGQLIPLTLTFTSDKPGAYQMMQWPFMGGQFEKFHVSPANDVVDPDALEPKQRWLVINGLDPPAGPVSITDRPLTVPLIVNQSIRFEQPGTYQLYVTTSRVISGSTKAGIFFVGKPLPCASNTIQLKIIPTDPVWAHQQAIEALKEVAPHYTGPMAVADPWGVLEYLGTHESARALLGLLADDKAPRSSETSSYECRPGLIAFPDQAWLIREMQRDLVAPSYPVTESFLSTLADLAAWQKHPKQQNTSRMMCRYWLTASHAAASKTGSAQAMTVFTLLDNAWLNFPLPISPKVTASLPRLKRLMTHDFQQLPPVPQELLLSLDWSRMQNPHLLPSLLNLWKKAQVVPNTEDFDKPSRESNGLILRRIYDLDPQRGRLLTIQEAMRAEPQVDFGTLSMLPDRTLPVLDKPLAKHLKLNQNVDMAAQLIARYATAAILPQVQAYNLTQQDYITGTALLAYFLRVDPQYGLLMLHKELLHNLGRGGQETLISDVAAYYHDPALQKYCAAELYNPDPGVAADAARTLGMYGSASAEPALWARLRHKETNVRSWKVIGQCVAEALSENKKWHLTPAQRLQIEEED